MNTSTLIDLFLQSETEFIQQLSQKTGKVFLNPEDIQPYIPFTKADVIEHIKKHKLAGKLLGFDLSHAEQFFRSAGSVDGVYMTPAGDSGKIQVYVQERGVVVEKKEYSSETEAVVALKKDYLVTPEEIATRTAQYVDGLFAIFKL